MNVGCNFAGTFVNLLAYAMTLCYLPLDGGLCRSC